MPPWPSFVTYSARLIGCTSSSPLGLFCCTSCHKCTPVLQPSPPVTVCVSLPGNQPAGQPESRCLHHQQQPRWQSEIVGCGVRWRVSGWLPDEDGDGCALHIGGASAARRRYPSSGPSYSAAGTPGSGCLHQAKDVRRRPGGPCSRCRAGRQWCLAPVLLRRTSRLLTVIASTKHVFSGSTALRRLAGRQMLVSDPAGLVAFLTCCVVSSTPRCLWRCLRSSRCGARHGLHSSPAACGRGFSSRPLVLWHCRCSSKRLVW